MKNCFIGRLEDKIMACSCKDENGSPLYKCLGTCKDPVNIINVEEQTRANFESDVLSEMKYMRNQISALAHQISNFSKMIVEASTDGFRNGFKEGYRLGYQDAKEYY